MPKPSDVNPKNFQVRNVIYNEDGFSIAYGLWEDGTMRLAMRWNGTGDDPGYPKLFKHPLWFQLPAVLSARLSSVLKGAAGANDDEIAAVLRHEGIG